MYQTRDVSHATLGYANLATCNADESAVPRYAKLLRKPGLSLSLFWCETLARCVSSAAIVSRIIRRRRSIAPSKGRPLPPALCRRDHPVMRLAPFARAFFFFFFVIFLLFSSTGSESRSPPRIPIDPSILISFKCHCPNRQFDDDLSRVLICKCQAASSFSSDWTSLYCTICLYFDSIFTRSRLYEIYLESADALARSCARVVAIIFSFVIETFSTFRTISPRCLRHNPATLWRMLIFYTQLCRCTNRSSAKKGSN